MEHPFKADYNCKWCLKECGVDAATEDDLAFAIDMMDGLCSKCNAAARGARMDRMRERANELLAQA